MEINFNTISLAVDFIILIGALCLAITRIYDFFAKPTSKLKTKKDEELKNKISAVLEETLPEALNKHDLEVRGRYLQDRYRPKSRMFSCSALQNRNREEKR